MLLALFVLAIFASGWFLSRWLWGRERRLGRPPDDLGPMGQLSSALLCGFAIWVAINWLLSAVGGIRPLPLCASALVGLAIALALARRVLPLPAGAPGPEYPGPSKIAVLAAIALAAAPVAIWIGFVLWRGALMPALNHDALAYHLPKAVLIAREHAYGYFSAPDLRITTLPCNYELLLSNIILLDGSDRITEWLGTLTYLALLAAAGAVAERWWGRGIHVLATVLVVAGVPVALLHSGAHKNDLMVVFFLLQAMFWAARWTARGEWPPTVLAVIALALAVGTKPHALIAGAVLAPVVLAGAWRRRQLSNVARPILSVTVLGAVALLLLGGASYLVNLLSQPHGPVFAGSQISGAYSHWANILWYPYLLLSAPFASHDLEVWVPWRSEYWFWPRYEIFFSNFGGLFTILTLLCPVLLLSARRGRWCEAFAGRRQERILLTALALLCCIFFLPIRFGQFGHFISFPRFTLFLPVVVGAWTVPIALAGLARLGRARPWAHAAALLALGGVFVSSALDYGRHDRFVPLTAVERVAQDPSLDRMVPFAPYRAASVVDHLAGQHDSVAIDGAYDTWTYPAYGRALQRPVFFIPPGPGPVEIPAEARWVAIDRGFSRAWVHPEFANLGQWRKYLGRGPVAPQDRRVFRHLAKDPSFQRVFYDRNTNQAVFRRIR